MADAQVVHAFVSLKPDSTDTSLVSSSEWNDIHRAQGGSSSQVSVRDTGAASGASWVHGPLIQRTSDAFNGSAGTTPGLASMTVNLTSAAYVQLSVTVKLTLAVGTAAIMSIYRDGVILATGEVRADSTYIQTFGALSNETGGTHTYNVVITGSSGVVTNATVILTALILGRL